MTSPKTYFMRYAQKLTHTRTSSVGELVTLAADGYPTAVEAVFFYAVAAGRTSYAISVASHCGATFLDEWMDIVNRFGCEGVEQLLGVGEHLPSRYRKALDSYLAYNMKGARTHASKGRCRRLTRAALEMRCVSLRRLAYEGGVDYRNLQAFLRHGDDRRLSLKSARRVCSAACRLAGLDDPYPQTSLSLSRPEGCWREDHSTPEA